MLMGAFSGVLADLKNLHRFIASLTFYLLYSFLHFKSAYLLGRCRSVVESGALRSDISLPILFSMKVITFVTSAHTCSGADYLLLEERQLIGLKLTGHWYHCVPD